VIQQHDRRFLADRPHVGVLHCSTCANPPTFSGLPQDSGIRGRGRRRPGIDNGWRFRNADAIPVYIVDATSLGQIETAFVPEGQRAIFISGRNLERQFDAFYLRGEKA
jgi:hypothetical protein